MPFQLLATADVIAPGGYLSITLSYTTGYDYAGGVPEHDLLFFDADNRLFWRRSDAKFVWLVGATELLSAACTFSAGQDITLAITHTTDGRSVAVTGATTGNGTTTTTTALDAIYLPSLAGVLDLGGGASVLLSLVPDLTPFAQLADDRALSQMDDEVGNRKFRDLLRELAEGPGTFRDVAMTVRSAFDRVDAFGDQLDMIGSVVGLAREGATDDRYRVLLGIQIELLLATERDGGSWTGTGENVLRISRAFLERPTGQITLRNIPPYAYLLSLPAMTVAELQRLVRFLRLARYAGVLGHVAASLGDDAAWGHDTETVPAAGIWGHDTVTITGASTWGTVEVTE